MSSNALGLPTPTLPFGGYVLFSIPCTCNPGSLWIFYAPFFNGTSIPTPGALVYTPFISTLYREFLPGVPTTWELGTYIPGAQSCLVGIPPAVCAPLPAVGVIKMLGTSFPGASPL